MITINVLLKVKPEQEQAYLEYVETMVHKSRADEGCLYYDHLKSVTAPYDYMIVENWENEEAVEKHNATDHLQNFLKEIPSYLSEDLVLKLSQS